ncbi:unnamed protein product [Tilletia laevis]|uniref:Putative lipoate-protein ligase A n=2 Tax=Tilletia TaxID=13289 RepID=A0A9N8QLP3_9BASI|nr:unnamed protein product [Tilletia caries]CAD6897034.1 unnamed protein product [Tilletia controversa]CAD6909585.1 unnamed protein product [Tilletia laevis]CAD6903380.1 unnamed protein product [Tilletia caries]CAD6929810.1 unnamed protein product [Tilletia caries]
MLFILCLAVECVCSDSELKGYISNSTSPTFNLALEDHLFRTGSLFRQRPFRPSLSTTRNEGEPDPRPVCLIYRNRPCVVIGRNQNPWKELNIREMARLGIPMIRRRSGGGAVFHDLGNTNYSIHVHKDDFTKRANAELVARALNSLLLLHSLPDRTPAPTVYVNHRSDICVRISQSSGLALPAPSDPTVRPEPPDPTERKVSGSAYKLTSHRAYHHGTLLLNADLDQLGHSLRNARGDALQSKGVASVRASVVNLVDAFPDARSQLSHEQVSKAIVAKFGQTYAASEHELGFFSQHPLEASMAEERSLVPPNGVFEDDSVFQESYKELQSWDWLFGQTPEFTHALVAQPQIQPTRTLQTKSQTPHQHLHSADPEPTSATFAHGTFGLNIRCRRGIIEQASLCGLTSPSSDLDPVPDQHAQPIFRDRTTEETIRLLTRRLEGKRYDEFAEEVPTYLDGRNEEDFGNPLRNRDGAAAGLKRAAQLLLDQDSDSSPDKASLTHTYVKWLQNVL